ncbi:MAG: hypothetical protein MJY99_03650 [Fibrobacter sp.]|nr:hypothetical protein [Fibrobacter sp.]
MALYKHWKKMALVLTSAFWASCDDSTSASSEDTGDNSNIEKQKEIAQSVIALYGVNPVYNQSSNSVTSSDACEGENCAAPESSSSEEPESSVSEEPASSESAAPKSSESEDPSANDEKIACEEATLLRTGPSEPCIEDICPEYGVPLYEISGLKCEDGEEYELESICPDYGIDSKCSDIYIGNNGKVYSEEEFKKIYKMAKADGSSSSSESLVPLSSNSNFDDVIALYGVQVTPLYGVEMPVEKEIDEPIAVYGPPCYFDGTCNEEENIK